MKDALVRLWGSRKTWSLSAGAVTAALVKVLGLVAIIYGWTPMRLEQMTQEITNLVALVFAVGGALSALFIALEDAARKWGVTDPLPHEVVIPVVRERREP